MIRVGITHNKIGVWVEDMRRWPEFAGNFLAYFDKDMTPEVKAMVV